MKNKINLDNGFIIEKSDKKKFMVLIHPNGMEETQGEHWALALFEHAIKLKESETELAYALGKEVVKKTREYFAARAPQQIPDWFEHKQREKPKSPEYSYTSDQQQKIDIARNEWFQQDRIDRITQWPWFWADSVLAQQEMEAGKVQFDFAGVFEGEKCQIKISVYSKTMTDQQKGDCARALMGNYWTKHKEGEQP